MVRYLYEHPKLARYLEGDPDLLIRGGHVRDKHLRRELITRAELESAARKQGIEGLEAVESCRLEVGGVLTFTAKTPTIEEQRHREILERLDRLERRTT